MSTQPHYGGSITKSGRLGSQPYEGHMFKVIVRIEKLVKFDTYKAANPGQITDKEIATVMGCSVRMLENYRNKPYYLKKRMENLSGIALNNDFTVEDTVKLQRKMLKEMMPRALKIVADELERKPLTLAERKHAVALAQDILDREGSLPKVSKTDVHHKVEHDYSKSDGVSSALLDAMGGAPQDSSTTTIEEMLTIAKKFSNSETLSAETQTSIMGELEAMPTPSDKVM